MNDESIISNEIEEVEGDRPGLEVRPHVLGQADRISWNLRFYYEQEEEDSVELFSAGWMMTKSKMVQPYIRTLTIMPGKRYKFDIGHVEEPGMMFIQNTTKWRGQLTPNAEQLKAIAESTLIIRIGDEVAGIIGPHELQPFAKIDPLRITLECETANQVRVKLATFSR